MSSWFDQWSGDLRDPDQREREETAGRVFLRLFAGTLWTAAVIGLALGAIWTLAGLWHAHLALR